MASFGKILGGAMAGIGEGMLEQAKARREQALLELRRQHELELAGVRHGYALEEIDKRGALDMEGRRFSAERDDARAERQNQFSLSKLDKEHEYRLAQTRAEMEGRRGLLGYEYSLKTRLERVKRATEAATAGLSESDKRLIEVLERNPELQLDDEKMARLGLDERTHDPVKVAQRLQEIGRPDLARVYASAIRDAAAPAAAGQGGAFPEPPRNLQGVPLQWDAATGQFRDRRDGSIYDKDGKLLEKGDGKPVPERGKEGEAPEPGGRPDDGPETEGAPVAKGKPEERRGLGAAVDSAFEKGRGWMEGYTFQDLFGGGARAQEPADTAPERAAGSAAAANLERLRRAQEIHATRGGTGEPEASGLAPQAKPPAERAAADDRARLRAAQEIHAGRGRSREPEASNLAPQEERRGLLPRGGERGGPRDTARIEGRESPQEPVRDVPVSVGPVQTQNIFPELQRDARAIGRGVAEAGRAILDSVEVGDVQWENILPELQRDARAGVEGAREAMRWVGSADPAEVGRAIRRMREAANAGYEDAVAAAMYIEDLLADMLGAAGEGAAALGRGAAEGAAAAGRAFQGAGRALRSEGISR